MSLSNSYNRGVLSGVFEAARTMGDISVFILHAPVSQDIPERVDGVIGAFPTRDGRTFPQSVPVVNVNSLEHPGTWQVCTDNDALGNIAFDHFQEKHFHHYAVIRNDASQRFWARLDAFAKHVRDSGHQITVIDDNDVPDIMGIIAELPRSTGIFFPTDRLAAHFVEGATQYGVRVPEHIATLSVNNDVPLCTRVTPQLTSISLDQERIGYEALSLLVSVISGKRVSKKPILIPPLELVSRESSAGVLHRDKDLVAAVAYMIGHISEPLVFADIQSEQGLSERALAMRFKERYGVSPMKYLRKLRLERVARYLENTDFTVMEIGRRCGMPSTNHLCALFKDSYGLTPLQYRKATRQ